MNNIKTTQSAERCNVRNVTVLYLYLFLGQSWRFQYGGHGDVSQKQAEIANVAYIYTVYLWLDPLFYSSFSRPGAHITHNASQPLLVQLETWVCYASRSESSLESLASNRDEEWSTEVW